MKEVNGVSSVVQYAPDGQMIIGNSQIQTVAETSTIIDDGEKQSVSIGQVVSNVIINSGGTQYVLELGFASDVTINSGGVQYIYGDPSTDKRGVVSHVTIYSGGTQYVSGGSVTSAVLDGGIQYVTYGGSSVSAIVNSGATLEGVDNNWGAIIQDATINSGATLITNGVDLEGVTTLNEGATINLGNQFSGSGSINLVGNGDHNIIVKSDGLSQTYSIPIEGFKGDGETGSDRILLQGVTSSNLVGVEYVDANNNPSDNYVTFQIKDTVTGLASGLTFNIIGVKQTGISIGEASDGSVLAIANSDNASIPCFLPGSMIKTPNGEIPIEQLSIGDFVCTHDWIHKKEVICAVKWVGYKSATVRPDLYDDEAGYPIRISKGAIIEGIPYKDLLVTSEHCLFFNGKFIPVRMLVNGASIRYDYSITSYDYYHIETEEHSVIWANGMLTESYLDTGHRNSFKQHGHIAYFDRKSRLKNWKNDAIAPLVVERSFAEPVYSYFLQRALDMGFVVSKAQELTNDSNFHLCTDQGDVIYPQFDGEDKYIFVLSENISTVYLCSRVARPCDVIGPFVNDRRQLGVLVGNVTVLSFDEDNNITPYTIKTHLEDKDLVGWDVLEKDPCRWTNGYAKLDLSESVKKKRALIIQIQFSYPYLKSEENNIKVVKNIA